MGASCDINGLIKSYGPKRVVDQVSLSIAAGEFLVFLGPSGCGKTTTLRMIAGLERPDGGVITIGGKVVSDAGSNTFVSPAQRDLGMVFQSYAIWPHMTVFENVAFPLRSRRMAKGADLRKRVDDVLQIVGLEGLGDRPSSALSGGQMQRVVLARAVVYDPQILLFDEPLSNLDLKMREHLRVELKALQARTGLTSVYVTHDQVEAVELADRIAVMNAGRIVQIGTARDIYRRPANRFVAEFISSANIFSGRVEIVGPDSTARVSTPQGRSFLASFEAPVQVGDTVDIVIHPEECSIRPGPARSDGDITVRVIQSRFQGVSIRHSVMWGEKPFDIVELGTGGALQPGDEAELTIKPQAAHILPETEPS